MCIKNMKQNNESKFAMQVNLDSVHLMKNLIFLMESDMVYKMNRSISAPKVVVYMDEGMAGLTSSEWIPL